MLENLSIKLSKLEHDKKKEVVSKNKYKNLGLKTYRHKGWFTEREDRDEAKKSADIPPISKPEGDKEEVKEETDIQILTQKSLLTKLPE